MLQGGLSRGGIGFRINRNISIWATHWERVRGCYIDSFSLKYYVDRLSVTLKCNEACVNSCIVSCFDFTRLDAPPAAPYLDCKFQFFRKDWIFSALIDSILISTSKLWARRFDLTSDRTGYPYEQCSRLKRSLLTNTLIFKTTSDNIVKMSYA